MAVYQYTDNLNNVFGVSARVKSAVPVPDNTYFSGVGWTNDYKCGYKPDSLLKGWQVEIPFQGLTAQYLLGWAPLNEAITIQEGLDPYEPKYDSTEDWRYYGSFLSGFFPGRLASGIASISAKEGECYATNPKGSLQTSGGSWDLYPKRVSVSTILGTSVPCLTSAGGRGYGDNADFQNLQVASVGSGYTFAVDATTYVGGVISANRIRFEELCFHLAKMLRSDQWSSDVKITGSSHISYHAYRKFSWGLERVGSDMVIATIDYEFRNKVVGSSNHPTVRLRDTPHISTYSVKHEIVLSLRNSNSLPSVIGPGVKPLWYSTVSNNSRSTYTLLSEEGPSIPYSYGYTVHSEVERSSWSSSSVHFAFTGVGALKPYKWEKFWHNLPGYHPAGADRLQRFRSDCDFIYNTDLKGIAAISAGKAFEQFKSSSNWFESAPEVTEILSFLPAVAEVGKIAGKLIDGDISVVPGLIKSLANAFLAYKFGLAPSIEDAKEVHRLAANAVRILGSESVLGSNTLYGSHKVEIPHEFSAPLGEGKLTCLATSKVVLRGSLGVNMVRYLQLLATGFGPTASNFLDTVPFSFVATWFTGLGPKVQNLDNNLGLALLPVHYYVHSVRLDYQMTPWELQREGLTSRDGLLMRRFIRRVSFHHPVPRDGRFDLLPPPPTSQFAAALGSLLVVSLG